MARLSNLSSSFCFLSGFYGRLACIAWYQKHLCAANFFLAVVLFKSWIKKEQKGLRPQSFQTRDHLFGGILSADINARWRVANSKYFLNQIDTNPVAPGLQASAAQIVFITQLWAALMKNSREFPICRRLSYVNFLQAIILPCHGISIRLRLNRSDRICPTPTGNTQRASKQ